MHHWKADVERLYVPRCEGDRGLMRLEMNFKTTTIGLQKYLPVTNDWMLQLVLQEKADLISTQNNKFKQELNLQDQTNEKDTCTLQAK